MIVGSNNIFNLTPHCWISAANIGDINWMLMYPLMDKYSKWCNCLASKEALVWNDNVDMFCLYGHCILPIYKRFQLPIYWYLFSDHIVTWFRAQSSIGEKKAWACLFQHFGWTLQLSVKDVNFCHKMQPDNDVLIKLLMVALSLLCGGFLHGIV